MRSSSRSSRLCRSCLACHLKLLNFLQSFVGISLVLYSLWVLNHWNRRHTASGPRGVGRFGFDLDDLPAPWFVCASMGFGALLCLVAFTGHVAAEVVSGCCLCFYAVLSSVLIVLESALVGYLVFNKHWEEDLPHDPTGELKRLCAFVEDNIDVFKWVAVVVIVVQRAESSFAIFATPDILIDWGVSLISVEALGTGGVSLISVEMALSLLLALVLRVIIPGRRMEYDSDEDFVVIRRPLLNPQGGPFPPNPVESKGYQSDIWSSRMRQKYGLNHSEYSCNCVPERNNGHQHCQ